MVPVETIARIVALVAHLRSGAPLLPSDADALAAAFERYLAGDDDLRAVLDLRPAANGWDPRRTWRIEQRDALIRNATAAHLKHHSSDARRAHELHTALRRYFDGTWRHDRTADEQPHKAGSLKAALWSILRIWPNVPTERRLRWILAARKPLQRPADGDIDDVENL